MHDPYLWQLPPGIHEAGDPCRLRHDAPMEIRPLTADDAEAAVDLWHLVGLTRPWNDPYADLARAMTGPSSTVLGGYAGNRLLATAMTGHDGHRGWLYYVAVHPGERGRGHGTAVMRAAEGWLRDRSIPKCQLMVRTGNDAAGFYGRLGYEPSDVTVLARWL